MSQAYDNIHLPNIELENGERITAGWYPVSISDISAVYELGEQGLKIKEDGNVSGMSELDVLAEAPEHYDIANQCFTDTIVLENGKTIQIENSKLINGKIVS